MDRPPERNNRIVRPRMPQEDAKPGRLTQLASWSIGCAGAILLAFVAFFLTLGASGPLMVLVAILFVVCLLHYLVWGRWLSGVLKEEMDRERAQAKSEERTHRPPTGRGDV